MEVSPRFPVPSATHPPRGGWWRRLLTLALVTGLAGGDATARAPSAAADALAKGKDEVLRGDYRAAVATLSEVVRELRYLADRDKEAAEGFLHLGMAYAGLGQAVPARKQFIQALVRDPSLTIDPKTAPPKAPKLFAEARDQGIAEGVLPGRKKMPAATKAVIGAGALAAAGAAALVVANSPGAIISPPPGFVPGPGGVSPFIRLLAANPGPGGPPLAGDVSVTWGVRIENAGQGGDYTELLLRAEALTSDGRPCMAGERAPFSFRPVIRLDYNVVLRVACPAPFQTQTLALTLEVPGTRQRAHQSTYLGVYRVGP